MTAAATPGASRATVVLPAYNSRHVIGAALASVPAGTPTVVVINGDADGTAAAAAAARADATILRPAANGGFGAACNLGLEAVDTEFVVFANPDVTLDPGCLLACAAAADRWPDIALFGPAPATAAAMETQWIAGAFMFARASAIRAVGGFDPSFFLYFEETDLQMRLVRSGHRVGVAPGARIVHRERASTAPEHDDVLEKSWLWGGACRYFADKHAGDALARRVERKLSIYRFRSVAPYAWLFPKIALVYAARVAGAAAVARFGPDTMRDNVFTGGARRAGALQGAAA